MNRKGGKEEVREEGMVMEEWSLERVIEFEAEGEGDITRVCAEGEEMDVFRGRKTLM